MTTTNNSSSTEANTTDKEQGRTCACMDDHPVYCTAYRYNESPETVRYNGDECQCVCHDQDSEDNYDFMND